MAESRVLKLSCHTHVEEADSNVGRVPEHTLNVEMCYGYAVAVQYGCTHWLQVEELIAIPMVPGRVHVVPSVRGQHDAGDVIHSLYPHPRPSLFLVGQFL